MSKQAEDERKAQTSASALHGQSSAIVSIVTVSDRLSTVEGG